jgi:endonuclease/exonuclease/phosphatase family metal-dependent hydrolase
MEKIKENTQSNSLFTKLVLGLNVFFILLLCSSYLAMYVNPNTLWIFAFCGIAYPFIFLGNLIIIVFWLIFKPKYALYSAFFILIGFNHIGAMYQFFGKSKPKDSNDLIKVMSYNVRLFDLYNYNKDWSYNFEGRNQIFNYLREENPDIVCFQEYFHNSTNEFCTTDSLKSILKTDYFYTYYPQVVRKIDFYGIAIYSRFPIINSGVIAFESKTSNTAIFIDIKKGDKIYRVYNAHLQSIRFSKEDSFFSEELQQNNVKAPLINKYSQKIIAKLKQAYLLRAGQAIDLEKHIKKSPYPVILCGDFNDTPTSFAYHTLSEKLTDCFIESGKGFGRTYSGKMPSFRIDYIFHDSHFKGYDFETHQDIKSSDHHPITVLLKEIK